MRRDLPRWRRCRALAWLLCALICLFALPAQAVTYANTSQAFNWIDASSHNKLGYNTTPYKFNWVSGCGTTPPIIDDTISDQIPIGFSFMYSGVAFTSVRVMSNGRVHFNNNVSCGYGSPVQQLPYPNNTLNYTMRIYGNDLDPTSRLEAANYNTPCASRASCYVSYATIGTAPYRSFVVTWNNVPEWATNNRTGSTAPVGSYSLQLILQENGEFVYQYGDDVPGPQAALGQVGWQADSSDYDTPQVGFPANNTAIKFYIPRPVVEYRMEQPSWNNTAGQVLDTSGNGASGTVLGAVQTIAAGRVCRAASVPLNTSISTVAAIDTGLSVPGVMGNAGTMTFWYKANTAWSGSGARDAQLLDATQTPNEYFFLVRRSNGALRFVVTDSQGVVRVVETAANTVPAGTWKHIAVSWNFNALVAGNSDHLRIYIDGVEKAEAAFTTNATLSPRIGGLFLGDNRGLVAAQGGTGNSTDGALDEFRAYNTEGIALIVRDMNLSQAGCLSHYAVSHSGSGLTCQQSTITITAHDLNHGNIVMPNNTTQIQLGTSNGLGDWSLVAGYGQLNNGVANDGVATYLFNGEYQAVFALSSGTADSITINVTDGQFTEAASEDPALLIKACVAARFNACEAATPRCVPNNTSINYARLNTRLADTGFKLDLVKLKTDATLESTFNGAATVDLLVNTNTGVSLSANNCPTSQTAVIPLGLIAFTNGYSKDSLTVLANAISAVAPNYSAYRDVRVRVSCTKADCGTATVGCSTDNFAIRPQQFSVSSNMNNADQAGAPKLAAGAGFTLNATAVAGYNGTPLVDNTLDGQKIVTHLGATDYTDRLLAGNSAPFPLSQASLATGVASNASVTYNDVGNFAILADGVIDNSWTAVDQPNDCVVGSGSNSVTGNKVGCNIGNRTQTTAFGRFYPHHYVLHGYLDAACRTAESSGPPAVAASEFTYMGLRELGVGVGAAAQSSGNLPLPRYTAGYPTLAVTSVAGRDGNTAVDLTGRLTPALPVLSWYKGSAGRFFQTDGAAYGTGATAISVTGSGGIAAGDLVKFPPDAAMYSVQGYAPAADGSGGVMTLATGLQQAMPAAVRGLTFLHSFDRLASGQDGPYDHFGVLVGINDSDGALISSVNGTAVTPAASVLLGATRLRHGRMRIDNMVGSELRSFPVPVAAQYWAGTQYQVNTLDNCTALLRKNFIMEDYRNLQDAQMPAATSIPADSKSLVAGKGMLLLDKPVLPVTQKGSFRLRSLFPYLPGDGRETIGIFKSGPVLYMREVY
ncbi:LamG domain-containing protein [Janthinobacterium sp. PC23-8]|uniref:LamG domain-containing protein n=1 Tax=Janthinobacterium sp. PC23-8 TaxID=2012679 RepID=UPI000B969E5E|nr:LamG domain-containing protein [Janthinobacterium sp. PC23-8]OYO27981.1 hypothetical protein CD932_23025 [Janthinobacterium sp. PC23-8]